MITDPNRKGDLSECKALVWLWEQGYEVFTNAGCTGDIDMIAIKDGVTIHIDVKTLTVRPDGEFTFRTAKHEQIRAKGIKILWVHGTTVGWNRDYF